MTDILIKLIIPQVNTKEDVEVPDDAKIDGLRAALAEEFELPRDVDGNPVRFCLENLDQRMLYSDADTLAGRGIRAGDRCCLTYLYGE